jgi:hypothetical protein
MHTMLTSVFNKRVLYYLLLSTYTILNKSPDFKIRATLKNIYRNVYINHFHSRSHRGKYLLLKLLLLHILSLRYISPVIAYLLFLHEKVIRLGTQLVLFTE